MSIYLVFDDQHVTTAMFVKHSSALFVRNCGIYIMLNDKSKRKI